MNKWGYTRVNDRLMKGRVEGNEIAIRELNWWERFICRIRGRRLRDDSVKVKQ